MGTNFSTHAIHSRKTNTASTVWVPPRPPVMSGVNPRPNMVPPMVSVMARMVTCHQNHVKKLTPVMVGPVFQGVGTGTGKFAPMPLPKVGELIMNGPVFPIPDHYSKYTPQQFGCSGSGLKVER